jgi:hypothetical protein
MAEPQKAIMLSDLMAAGPKPARKALPQKPRGGITYHEARQRAKELRNGQA